MIRDKEYIESNIRTLNRLSKVRQLTSTELHDLALMKSQLEEYDQK